MHPSSFYIPPADDYINVKSLSSKFGLKGHFLKFPEYLSNP